MTNEQKVWGFLKANGGFVATVGVAERTGIPMALVSSCMTSLFRKNLIEMQRAVSYNENTARRQTQRTYKAVGAKWESRRPKVVAVKTALVNTDITRQHRISLVTDVAPIVRPAPPVHHTQPGMTEAEEFAAFLEFKAMKKQLAG